MRRPVRHKQRARSGIQERACQRRDTVRRGRAVRSGSADCRQQDPVGIELQLRDLAGSEQAVVEHASLRWRREHQRRLGATGRGVRDQSARGEGEIAKARKIRFLHRALGRRPAEQERRRRRLQRGRDRAQFRARIGRRRQPSHLVHVRHRAARKKRGRIARSACPAAREQRVAETAEGIATRWRGGKLAQQAQGTGRRQNGDGVTLRQPGDLRVIGRSGDLPGGQFGHEHARRQAGERAVGNQHEMAHVDQQRPGRREQAEVELVGQRHVERLPRRARGALRGSLQPGAQFPYGRVKFAALERDSKQSRTPAACQPEITLLAQDQNQRKRLIVGQQRLYRGQIDRLGIRKIPILRIVALDAFVEPGKRQACVDRLIAQGRLCPGVALARRCVYRLGQLRVETQQPLERIPPGACQSRQTVTPRRIAGGDPRRLIRRIARARQLRNGERLRDGRVARLGRALAICGEQAHVKLEAVRLSTWRVPPGCADGARAPRQRCARAPDARQRFLEPPLGAVEQREIVDRRRHGRVVQAERTLLDAQGALVKRFCIRRTPLPLVQLREAAQCLAHAGVPGSKCVFANRQSASIERLGLGLTSLHPVKPRETEQRLRHIRVFRPERRFVDGQRPSVKRLCLCRAPLRAVQIGEVAQRRAHIQMACAVCLLADRESAPVERLGFRMAPLRPVKLGEVVRHRRPLRVRRPTCFFDDVQGAPIERFGLRVAPLRPVELGEVVQGCADVGVVRAERLLIHAQHPPVERLGLHPSRLAAVQQGQVVDGGGEAPIRFAEILGGLERRGEAGGRRALVPVPVGGHGGGGVRLPVRFARRRPARDQHEPDGAEMKDTFLH